MENKYTQETKIELKRVWTNEEGITGYNYVVPVIYWNVEEKKYDAKFVIINSKYEHDLNDKIHVKQNKNHKGEIYYTEVNNEELPF